MKCLVAIVDPERDRAVVDLAVALAAGEELILMSAIEVPEGDTLASVQPEARRLRRTLDQLAPADAHVRTLVTVARQGWQAEELVLTYGEAEFADWLAERGLVPYTLNGFPIQKAHFVAGDFWTTMSGLIGASRRGPP